MLSTYDMECLSRLEDRWLDPDYNAIPEDEEEWENYELLKGDSEWAERAVYSTSQGSGLN